jgi:hypothetical protein
MKLKFSSFLFVLILIYPVWYALPPIHAIEFTFSVVYLFFMFLMTIVSILLIREYKVNKWTMIDVSLIIILILITIFNTGQLRYTKPLLFIIGFGLLYLFSRLSVIILPVRFIRNFTMAFISLNLLFLVLHLGFQDGRFSSFLISPTVFTVYCEAIFILCYAVLKKTSYRFVLFVVFGLLIFVSQTRINILVFTVTPIFFWFWERGTVSYRTVGISILALFIFVYPLYTLGMEIDVVKNFLMLRAQDGRDSSAELRFHLYNKTFEVFSNGTFMEKLFGHGSEYSRLLMKKLVKEDTYPHNDILRLMVDFGVVYTVIFLYLILKASQKTIIAAALFVIFVSSFYHNMIYDFYIPFLIILLSRYQLPEADLAEIEEQTAGALIT